MLFDESFSVALIVKVVVLLTAAVEIFTSLDDSPPLNLTIFGTLTPLPFTLRLTNTDLPTWLELRPIDKTAPVPPLTEAGEIVKD